MRERDERMCEECELGTCHHDHYGCCMDCDYDRPEPPAEYEDDFFDESDTVREPDTDEFDFPF